MFCPNRISDENAKQMRQNLVEQKKHLLHYKKLYSTECKCSSLMQKEISKLRRKIEILECDVNELSLINEGSRTIKHARKARQLKKWENIKSERTKRRRFAHYKDMIFETLCNIGVCHRAEITMWFKNNHVHFSWSPQNFNAANKTSQHANQTRNICDHTYSRTNLNNDHDFLEEYHDVNYSEIFDTNGNWEKQHIRRLVHVLDTFRISHEAYHEIRMVSKGHLPPINKLRKEKKIMSEELPYVKIENVSLFYCGQFIFATVHRLIVHMWFVFMIYIVQCYQFDRKMPLGDQ